MEIKREELDFVSETAINMEKTKHVTTELTEEKIPEGTWVHLCKTAINLW